MEHAFHLSGSPGRRRLLSGLVAAAALSWLSPARAAEPTPEQVEEGREVYAEFCASCHGRDMVNAGGFAFDLRTFPKADLDRFRNAVLNGKGQGMPAWRDKLADDDLTVLWAYIRSGGSN